MEGSPKIKLVSDLMPQQEPEPEVYLSVDILREFLDKLQFSYNRVRLQD